LDSDELFHPLQYNQCLLPNDIRAFTLINNFLLLLIVKANNIFTPLMTFLHSFESQMKKEGAKN